MATTFPLYPRSCEVQVGSVLVPADPGTGFHVEFKIKRGVHVTAGSLKPQPNTCSLKMWNLGVSTQQQIAASAGTPGIVPAVISAGYFGHRATVFNGQLRAANTVTNGDDSITELTTGDGDHALQQRLNLSFGKGATSSQVLQAIISALGVGAGNLQNAIALLNASPIGGQLYARGLAMKGSAAEAMTDLCRSAGLAWSIQDGALQVTQLGQPLPGESLLLDSGHGMVGSPTVDTMGILSVTTAMIPGVVPGLTVSIQGSHLQGTYRVIGVETEGDNFENRWFHHIEAVRLGAA
jgi:hypothetical protein